MPTESSDSASRSKSDFTHAFVDAESEHPHHPSTIGDNLFVGSPENPHHPSTIGDNLFVGSSEDVMTRVRYRPVDARGDSELRPRMNHRVSTTSSASSYSAASDDGFTDEQFLLHSTKKIPYKAIGLAVFLFFLGTVMCIIGGLLLSGIYLDQKYNDRTWPVLTLGLIMFIPGSYHVRIAYYAWKGVRGYQYSDIPNWD